MNYSENRTTNSMPQGYVKMNLEESEENKENNNLNNNKKSVSILDDSHLIKGSKSNKFNEEEEIEQEEDINNLDNNIDNIKYSLQKKSEEDEAVAEYKKKTGSGNKKKTVGTFTGTFHAGTVIPEKNLFLSDNKFYYSVGKTKCKAFRAYFWFEDVLEDINNAGSRITLQFNEDGTTGIRNIKRETITNNPWYTLDGRKLDKKPAEKGIYIRNNKKVVIE